MRGDAGTIKERLDIAEVIGQYVKLEKSGKSLKGRCPFHNEKTPSFFVSPERQSYYCFGCGAKGDIFSFVEQTEGLEFKDALKLLADRAGVELVDTHSSSGSRDEKSKLYAILEDATIFFEENIQKQSDVLTYLSSRGVSDASIKLWRLGFAPDEWRALYKCLSAAGSSKELMEKAGLIKVGNTEKEPYDTFRGRVIFPFFDPSGRVIAFSGRAFDKETQPKYLNSPDTLLFNKSEVLYGFDKAKEEIRKKKNYAVLVEGQMDLVLSHQAGVKNTVATSGTAFTQAHLERLKRLSPRIILAFDGDEAGEKAAEKSVVLALSLGMEVKVAVMPAGKDPADLVKEDPEKWKEVLRESKHAIEVFLNNILLKEKDHRKAGKLVEKKILPLIALLESAIERSHFVSMVAKKTGIKEDIVWEDLKRITFARPKSNTKEVPSEASSPPKFSRMEKLEEIEHWLKDTPDDAELLKEEKELKKLVRIDELTEKISELKKELALGHEDVLSEIQKLMIELDELKIKVV